jgi:peptidoglycan/LPS O-acetylase OafA/YrhL
VQSEPVRHHHLGELQAIRGLAAVVVLLHHTLFYFATTPGFRWGSEALLNAHGAVVLFFVLSGFVLTRSLQGREASIRLFATFFVRRAFRILPALWAALLLASLYLFALRGEVSIPFLSHWIDGYHPDTTSSVTEVATAAVGANASLLPPLWSIRTELIASCFIPFMAGAVVYGRSAVFGIATVAAIAALGGEWLGRGAFIYLTDFVLGAAILVMPSPDRWSSAWRKAILAVSLLVLMFGRLVNADWRFETGYHAVMPGLIEGVAAMMLIYMLVSDRRLGRMLRHPSLVWIGDISYSLYLVHFPVMALTAMGLFALLPDLAAQGPDRAAMLLATGTLIFSLGLAHVSYVGIELPGIGLGRWVLGRIFPRRSVAAR